MSNETENIFPGIVKSSDCVLCNFVGIQRRGLFQQCNLNKLEKLEDGLTGLTVKLLPTDLVPVAPFR